MTKTDLQKNGKNKPTDANKKTYCKPEILSREELEVVAATCDGSKAVFVFGGPCGQDAPLNS